MGAPGASSLWQPLLIAQPRVGRVSTPCRTRDTGSPRGCTQHPPAFPAWRQESKPWLPRPPAPTSSLPGVAAPCRAAPCAGELSRGLHPLGVGRGTRRAATWTAASRMLSLQGGCVASGFCTCHSLHRVQGGRWSERAPGRRGRRAVPGGPHQASTALLRWDCPANSPAGLTAGRCCLAAAGVLRMGVLGPEGPQSLPGSPTPPSLPTPAPSPTVDTSPCCVGRGGPGTHLGEWNLSAGQRAEANVSLEIFFMLLQKMQL